MLADVGHRLHHLARRPKDWDAFFAAAPADVVLEVGAQFARQAAQSHRIVYLTGRPERCRAATQEWLDRNALPPGDLLMRPAGDRRPGSVVKVRELRRLSSTIADRAVYRRRSKPSSMRRPRPVSPCSTQIGCPLWHCTTPKQRDGRT